MKDRNVTAEPEINDRPRRRMPAQDDGRQNEREETCRQERDDGQQPEINSVKAFI